MTRWQEADLRKAQESTETARAGPLLHPPPKPTSKYRNKKTNGYASIKEAKRAAELKLLLAAGAIRNLREQVEFELVPKQGKERAVRYRADFCYLGPCAEPEFAEWQEVVEDCKGMRTPDYIIKRKLMLFIHGITIRET